MAAKANRRIVIDACIARAAGGENATFPDSKQCRDFLHAFLELSHEIVRTREIWDEWREHKSNYSRIWLSSMIAKKRVHTTEVALDAQLRKLLDSEAAEKKSEAMQKDCHLVEAAKATDRIVISKDDSARNNFGQMTKSVGWLKTIAWVNPCVASECAIGWLQEGASVEPARCLQCRVR